MLNLLGNSKENIKKLLQKINYKVIEKNEKIFFKYIPKKINKKTFDKKITKENPFNILKNLSFS